MPMGEDLYHQLSGVSIHTNPNTTPQSYNPLEMPTMGGYFQGAGSLVLLNELGRLIVFILWFGSKLLNRRIVEGLEQLDINIGWEEG